MPVRGVNAGIPLQGRIPRIDVPNFAAIRQATREGDRRENLLDLQQRQFEQQQAEFAEGAPTRALQRDAQREDLRFRSLVHGALELQPQLEADIASGDFSGSRSLLERRRANLLAVGNNDTAETDEVLELLDSDPQRAMMLANNAIAAGQARGLLAAPSAPPVEKGFSLGQGQTRFDAQGNAIASVAPRPASGGLSFTTSPDGSVTFSQGGLPVGQGPIKQAAGPKKADQQFAETFVEWTTGGGADSAKLIGQLEEASAALRQPGASLTGPLLGLIPDFALAQFNPEAISVREGVEEVVQRNLRLILGAQFTAKEGERLIARAFNPKLGEAENAKRVDRLIQQMKTAARAKESAVAYFRKNRTLEGWNGRLATKRDFELDDTGPRADPADDAGASGAAPESMSDDELLRALGG